MKVRAAVFLLVLGVLTMAGDLLGLDALKGLGAATGASVNYTSDAHFVQRHCSESTGTMHGR